MLLATNEDVDGYDLRFRSSDYNGDAQFRPKLEIRWTLATRTTYFLKDHLGTTRVAITDAGDVVGYDDYDPWGLILANRSMASQPDMPFKYTGKEWDDDNGLDWYYFGARYYDPVVGRWNGVDPLAGKYADLTPYNYALNSPLKFVDPNGEEVKISYDQKNDVYTITVTASLVNESSMNLSGNALASIAKLITQQITNSFSNVQNATVNVSVNINTNPNNVKLSDHIFALKNPKDKSLAVRDSKTGKLKGYAGGRTVNSRTGKAQKFGDKFLISTAAFNIPGQTRRTGAHEFGHGLGLLHNEKRDGAGNVINTGNLMLQSQHSSGTIITKKQIEQAYRHSPEYWNRRLPNIIPK